jgi:surface protein
MDLSNFNTNNVTYMQKMFEGCSSLTSLNLINFNCDKIDSTEKMSEMFKGCQYLTDVKFKDFKIRLLIDLKNK